jgi:hypothetical protein
MTRRNFSNTATPQILQGSVGASDTVFNVPSTVSYPSAANPFVLSIDRGLSSEEVCLCTATTGTTFTVTRGYDGTTAVAHSGGTAIIEHSSSAIDVAEPNVFINLMTTTGDLLFRDSGGAARLPVGTGSGPGSQVLGVSGGKPTWQAPVADSGWINATLTNGWTNTGNSGTPAYRKIDSRVQLRGEVHNTSYGTSCFTLPSGYRPGSGFPRFAVQGGGSGSTPTYVWVASDTGTVNIAGGPAIVQADLSVISFLAN